MKSPVKWLTDAQYSALPTDQRAIAWADSQVGVKEQGWNKGKEVIEYQKAAGLGSGGGFAWCAAFVTWCWEKAGGKGHPKDGANAAVRNWASWAKGTLRRHTTPERGRLFYWLNADGTGHIGFCLGPSVLGVFRTIEGNTDSGQGSREGDGVYKRTRTIWQLKNRHSYGFIDLGGL